MELVIPSHLPTNDSMATMKAEYGEDVQFEFRAVVKTKGGLAIVDFQDFSNKTFTKHPAAILNHFKKGALQSVDFRPIGGNYWFTAFRRVGKKIHMIDKSMLANLKVGTINSCWYNTELYNWEQYKAVKAKSWDCYAYRMNTNEKQVA